MVAIPAERDPVKQKRVYVFNAILGVLADSAGGMPLNGSTTLRQAGCGTKRAIEQRMSVVAEMFGLQALSLGDISPDDTITTLADGMAPQITT